MFSRRIRELIYLTALTCFEIPARNKFDRVYTQMAVFTNQEWFIFDHCFDPMHSASTSPLFRSTHLTPDFMKLRTRIEMVSVSSSLPHLTEFGSGTGKKDRVISYMCVYRFIYGI